MEEVIGPITISLSLANKHSSASNCQSDDLELCIAAKKGEEASVLES